MSDFESGEFEDVSQGRLGLGIVPVLLNWAGAIVSVGLIVGLVIWAVRLGARDPNEIPIVRAMEGPARVLPTDPGGQQAAHQGLAVNSVQSDGSVQNPSDVVVLAPAPAKLSEEDVAGSGIKPSPRVKSVVMAAIDQDLKIRDVEQTSLTPEAVLAEPAKAAKPKTLASPHSPSRSPRPVARPQGLKSRVVATNEAAREAQEVQIGTRLVQLGAYDSRDLAISEWAKLAGKHADLLEGKQRLIQTASSGGRQFYRLRAVGFETLDDSRAMCSALLARGTPCIPVTAR